jgi:hypothetical protein
MRQSDTIEAHILPRGDNGRSNACPRPPAAVSFTLAISASAAATGAGIVLVTPTASGSVRPAT